VLLPCCAAVSQNFGGNIDNRRIGKGATMYYPVQVSGALLSMGDAHAAQGDSELDGTAVETSITARVKITLHKKSALPKLVQVRGAAGKAAL
jgi:acetamidase/formamidase